MPIATAAKTKQGQHVDPESASAPALNQDEWPARRRHAFASPAMNLYREGLLLSGAGGVRESVLDDLASYYHLSPDDCVRRCVDWEQWSVEEWFRSARNTPEEIAEFYRSLQSWSFDLLWYGYLQAEGHLYPVSVAIANSLRGYRQGRVAPLVHLDFGSGIGTTSQLFLALGYKSDLADISTSLLDFARYRLSRRDIQTRYIDLNLESLAPGRYDVITAVDTLVHVPDLPETARLLHRALKPGGLLFANFDTRPPTAENAWHLYSDDLPLRWQLHRAGFEPIFDLDHMATCYRRVEAGSIEHGLHGLRDSLLLRSPLRPAFRKARSVMRR